MMFPGKRLLVFLTLGLVFAAMPTAFAQKSVEEERLLKAVFIYNFAKFTRWPDSTWQGESVPMRLCTFGQDKLAEEVGRLSGRVVQGRLVTVVALQEPSEAENCQVLYIAHSTKSRYREIVSAVRNEPVLTVSEIEGFGLAGGAIELYQEKDKIRFRINVAVVREAGLIISSRLLSLAEVIGMEEPR